MEFGVNKSKTAIFEAAEANYNGHTYHLSKIIPRDIGEADSLCKLFSGYVAEINDLQELNFASDFVYKKSGVAIHEHVSLGVTQQGHAGQWTYLTDDKPAFLKWAPGQPNGNEDCVVFASSTAMMYDYPCYSSRYTRFLCEMAS